MKAARTGRDLVKSLVASVVWRVGVLELGRWRTCHRLPILTYHGVLDPARSGDPYLDRNCVDSDMFRWQMAHLSRRHHCVGLADAISRLARGASLPPRAAVVTFDDGFRNVYTRAFPVLRRYGIPATVFLTTGHVGCGVELLWTERVAWLLLNTTVPLATVDLGDLSVTFPLRSAGERRRAARETLALLKTTTVETRHRAVDALEQQLGRALDGGPPDPERYAFLDWTEIRQMSGASIEFGSHTVTHPIVSQLDDAGSWREIVESKREIDRQLGRPCVLFSYPNGTRADFGERDRLHLARAGYLGAVSQVPGLNGPDTDCFALRRINIGRGHTPAVFVAQLSGVWTWIGELRARPRSARRRLDPATPAPARQALVRRPGGADG